MKPNRKILLLAFALTGPFLFSQNVSVSSQDGCPVRISNIHIQEFGKERGVSLEAQNVSSKAIEAIGVRATKTRASASGASAGGLLLTSLVNGERSIQPNQSAPATIQFGYTTADSDRDSISVSVDYVQFRDGTRWGPDTLKYSDSVYQIRMGAQSYKNELGQQKNGSQK